MNSESPRILVAGIGNIFLGDDGFGVEVVRRLMDRGLPENVQVFDFGIRGFDLLYALLDGYDLAILIDAAPRGGEPGTLYTIEPDAAELEHSGSAVSVETHGMDPQRVLAMAKAMGGEIKRLLVVGCEPAELGEYEEGRLGLSERVSASIADAVAMVEKLVSDALANREIGGERIYEKRKDGHI